ncbi:hypothetical protein BD410DRAFT_525215 [Rickenella mellea]|uniref:F-box domain-containing protein n=1 Tax=Rickenella mellea TaxID=50990 RepID=A0A4Y7QHG7_9AGAM|nr:hypothetical protein BD410DRAFT_525215 [Rickenella mellea]
MIQKYLDMQCNRVGGLESQTPFGSVGHNRSSVHKWDIASDQRPSPYAAAMTPSLPTELLKAIFRYATYAGVDPSSPAVTGAKTDWFAKFEGGNLETMETKIALTRVSRRFRQIALEFLFEFVSIDKPSQAVKLAALMKKQSSNTGLGPGKWIMFLFVRCPESNTRLITKILHFCRDLRGFSWNPTTSRTRLRNGETAQDEMIQNIPINIRFLHWNTPLDQTNTFAAFLHKASASLQILYIGGILRYPTSQWPHLHVSYPSLTHLQVEDTYPFQCLATWTMPSLIDLDLIARYWGGSPVMFPNVGSSLRVLRFSRSFTLLASLLAHILDDYPNLEEIYYHYFTFRRSSLWDSDARHMKMKKVVVGIAETVHMDIEAAQSSLRHNFGPISKTRFPSLDTIIVDVVSSPLIPKGTKFLMTRVSEDFLSAKISIM